MAKQRYLPLIRIKLICEVLLRYTMGMRIHFICHGNGLRSILAEAYLQSRQLPGIEVISSGTQADYYTERHLPVSQRALQVLDRRGIRIFAKDHRSQLTQDRLRTDDIVICMSPSVFKECQQMVRLPEQTYAWHIADIGEGTRLPRPGHDEMALIEDMLREIIAETDALLTKLGKM